MRDILNATNVLGTCRTVGRVLKVYAPKEALPLHWPAILWY
jgi:hypothetical protein